MQFYIIHPDPKTNADLLPEYAIKKVNCREGIQILSDIGHNLGITWEGQNKPYSIWHAETRRFMVNREAFHSFNCHLLACLFKLEQITGKRPIYTDKFCIAPYITILEALPENRTHEEFMRDYLLRGKRKHLSDVEIKRLENVEYEKSKKE